MGDLIDLCPEGYYCPEGTAFDWQPCVPGTYNNETGLSAEDQCRPCTGGHYCDGFALTTPTAECAEGHYCEYRVDTATPTGSDNITTPAGGMCFMNGKQFALFSHFALKKTR